jgi:hypothetical protein
MINPIQAIGGSSRGSDQPGKMQIVYYNGLRPGQILAHDMRTRDGTIVATANTPLTPLMVARLLEARASGMVPGVLVMRSN